MTAPARRPWRWKRRWLAFAAVWLALPPAVFLAAEGPVLYGVGRGWLSPAAYNRVYYPVWRAMEPALPVELQTARFRYSHWWIDAGNDDR